MGKEFWNWLIIGTAIVATGAVLYVRVKSGTRYDFKKVVDHFGSAFRWYIRLIIVAGVLLGLFQLAKVLLFPDPPTGQTDKERSRLP